MNSNEHIPWKANSFSANQDIPHTLQNLNIHYYIHRSPPITPVLSQINPDQTLPTSFFKKNTDGILPIMWCSSKPYDYGLGAQLRAGEVQCFQDKGATQ